MGMFFSDNEDDIARRRAENSDKSLFFSENEDDVARRKVLNSDKSLFFSESDDDIARRKALNSDKSLFFSESDDDIARRKALNSDKSLFFSKNCNNEKGEEMGIFYDNSKKISYEEMYSEVNETNERIEENKKNEIEVHKEFVAKKEIKGMKEKKYYCIIHTALFSDNGKFKTVILECIDRGTADDINRFISGNYFKTYEIAKEVQKSDIWKNKFLDFRKNKEKKDELLEEKIYYTIDDGVNIKPSFNLYCLFDFKIGNYFTTKEEALDFFENDYPKSIKRIKDFTNELMKKNEYKICGYDLIEK